MPRPRKSPLRQYAERATGMHPAADMPGTEHIPAFGGAIRQMRKNADLVEKTVPVSAALNAEVKRRRRNRAS